HVPERQHRRPAGGGPGPGRRAAARPGRRDRHGAPDQGRQARDGRRQREARQLRGRRRARAEGGRSGPLPGRGARRQLLRGRGRRVRRRPTHVRRARRRGGRGERVRVRARAGVRGRADRLAGGAGDGEARYHLVLPEGGTRVVGRSAPFTARAVAASLQAPDEVAGGTAFYVAWEGPDNPGDIVTVAPVGADQAVMLSYTFTSFGNPARLTAPVDPGEYEVRYLAGSGGGVLSTRALRVAAAEVSVTAPAEVMGGTDVAVPWQGPDGPGDMIAF